MTLAHGELASRGGQQTSTASELFRRVQAEWFKTGGWNAEAVGVVELLTRDGTR